MKIEMAKMFCYLKVLHFNHDVLGRLFKTAGHWAKSWHLNRRSGSLCLYFPTKGGYLQRWLHASYTPTSRQKKLKSNIYI